MTRSGSIHGHPNTCLEELKKNEIQNQGERVEISQIKSEMQVGETQPPPNKS